ncbi:putative transcription factor interactor and regulator CCHC(Zn) family [Helianthus anomalus]
MSPKSCTVEGSNNALPATPEELAVLAVLISQHVNVALAQREATNVVDQTHGNQIQGCSYKTFQACQPRSFVGTEGPLGVVRWIERMEVVMVTSNCSAGQRVKYALGEDAAYGLYWIDFKDMLMREYCPRSELQKDMARLVPYLVTPEYKRIERYIWGLAPEIRGLVTPANPTTINEAMRLACSLIMIQCIWMICLRGITEKKAVVADKKLVETEQKPAESKKRWSGSSGSRSGNKIGRDRGSSRMYAANASNPKKSSSPSLKCNTCGNAHSRECKKCGKCNRFGHLAQDCRAQVPGNYGNRNCGCYERFLHKNLQEVNEVFPSEIHS